MDTDVDGALAVGLYDNITFTPVAGLQHTLCMRDVSDSIRTGGHNCTPAKPHPNLQPFAYPNLLAQDLCFFNTLGWHELAFLSKYTCPGYYLYLALKKKLCS